MNNTSRVVRSTASFRDPSGFIFRRDGVLYRQINTSYQADYQHLMDSGLYTKLVKASLLVPHEDVGLEFAASDDAFTVIQPDDLGFISYPYEWSFGQLKAAALATLKIQKLAFQHGMSLKDSSAYNIQFVDGHPLLIDTLSFERYEEGSAWVAYRQFCQHFLAPLALMSYADVRLSRLLRVFIDGIPLDMASRLLPWHTRLRMSLLIHVHLHANSQKKYQARTLDTRVQTRKISRQSLLGLIDNLEAGVKKLDWLDTHTDWANYYADDSYSARGFAHKQQIVTELIALASPRDVWDLGANTGVFSRIASAQGIPTLAWDVDPGAVELNYRQVVKDNEKCLLPLVLDLTNPSSALGWANHERLGLMERGPSDLVLALALIHHLAISNNVPLADVADFLHALCSWLVIEFVPKQDPKVQTLLATRRDIFDDYTEAGFEAAFAAHFTVEQKRPIEDSARVLYLMRAK